MSICHSANPLEPLVVCACYPTAALLAGACQTAEDSSPWNSVYPTPPQAPLEHKLTKEGDGGVSS